ncbi:hypothetical protein RM704_20510 [Streptomyces sp. DSM 3412]|uniref:Uncharacterized protein n=1 Tax=Streptomyces gottesmaniae TaxID=3075518 RepID=A0ABU2Z110_9ACTN|nr:hypothetical protein [Streptomyces sp. DSM 3412]MDT0569823.1 hypothetical protein [Streptomyces sp. DSM 3412]
MRRTFARCLAVATATVAALVPTVGTASADGGFHFLALRANADVQSVYVNGRGWTNWTDGSQRGTIGDRFNPVALSVCYMYSPTNGGQWARAGDGLRAHTNEAPGRQGVQSSNPRFVDGAQLSVTTLRSSDCTAGALGSRRVTVPSDELASFWLDLR